MEINTHKTILSQRLLENLASTYGLAPETKTYGLIPGYHLWLLPSVSSLLIYIIISQFLLASNQQTYTHTKDSVETVLLTHTYFHGPKKVLN